MVNYGNTLKNAQGDEITVSFGFFYHFLTDPIINLPRDWLSVKRIVKNTEFPRAIVRTTDTVSMHYLVESKHGLELWNPQRSIRCQTTITGISQAILHVFRLIENAFGEL